jgi:hypothetical protein
MFHFDFPSAAIGGILSALVAIWWAPVREALGRRRRIRNARRAAQFPRQYRVPR